MSLHSNHTLYKIDRYKTDRSFRYWSSLLAGWVLTLFIIPLHYPAAVHHYGFQIETFLLISITVPFGSVLFEKRLAHLKDPLGARSVGQLIAGYYQHQALQSLLRMLTFFIVSLYLGTVFSLFAPLLDLMSSDGMQRLQGDHSPQLVGTLQFTLLIGTMGVFFIRLLCQQMAHDLFSIRKHSFEALPPSEVAQLPLYSKPLFIGLALILSGFFSYASGADAIKLCWLGLAVALQMVPSCIGLRFVPWFTGRAVFYGLIAGVLVVLLTDLAGLYLNKLFAFNVTFSPHPLQIFSGVWGVLANLLVVFVLSAFTQTRNSLEHRTALHKLCEDHGLGAPARTGLKLFTWIFCFFWFFFAIGPGAVLGIELFTSLAVLKGLPSPLTPLLIWCALWWVFGVFMLWLLVDTWNM